MSIARGPVERPVLTFIIFFIVVILGLVAFSRLPIDLMPEITNPTLSISTNYSNVGPREIEDQITRPIEEAIAAVQGVVEITSTSSEGRSNVRLSFKWGTDLDVAANDLRDRIDRILSRLPEEVERPSIRKFDLSAFPVLVLGVSSDMRSIDLRQLVEDQLKYRLERIPGVASVDIRGGLSREIHIFPSAGKLDAYSLSIDNVISALKNENRNIPAGIYPQNEHDILLRTQGEFSSLQEIRNTVIATRNNQPILVSDIAEVEDSHEEITSINRINLEPGLRLSISKQSGANTVKIADAVNAELAKIRQDYSNIQIIPLIDSSKYIKNSINNMSYTILIGGLLAIIILFLFLRNVTSTAIITTAIPVSIIAAFGLLYFNGLTLNIMTFGGLALGIGMLMDSSIVVLENIFRHTEQGYSSKESALLGTDEVWSAIVASVLTTIVVFLPVVFVRGMSGIMFQQMAIVVSFSLLCSLIVSLTLVPMLSSQFLKTKAARADTWQEKLFRRSESIFIAVENRYGNILRWALVHRRTVIVGSLTLFAMAFILVRYIGVELMPETDEGEVRVSVEAALGTKLAVMDTLTAEIEGIIKDNVPEMVSLLSRIGGSGWRGSGGNSSSIQVMLTGKGERKRSSRQIADKLRADLQNIPGAKITTRPAGGLWILRMGSSDDNISLEVRGHDLEIANKLAIEVEKIIKSVPGITDTRISREEGMPEQVIRVDRQKAADLGLSVSDIGETLQTAVSGSQVSYFREAGKQYRIMIRLPEEDRSSLDKILDLKVLNNRSEPVILRNVVNTEEQEGPKLLERKDQERVIYVTANFTDRDMGSVIADIREKLPEVPVPKDFSIMLGGDYEEQQKSFRELIFGFILAVVLVYLVMAGQFESFRDPFVILFSIPMALVGIVITMLLTKTVFSIQALIGCIMLAGIVVNNAILLVDYTNRLRRKKGMQLFDAIVASGSRRLRPILMTTFTTSLGLLPLSLGLGEGGETQAPMARVVIGGLLSSTFITLVLVPVIYSIFEKKKRIEEEDLATEDI
ncbi:MAG: efflux RND transporter permease subunit [Candidatus Cloacimonetes bacterium]|nr:efflux RND transporter permease subunit [Candidatus Cloacimonadota bacterium]